MEAKEVKTLPFAEFKLSADASGTFEGRASTFGTIDSYGDRIAPGAYKDTIPQFLERGFIGWGHDWSDPIGYVTDAEERADGLWITGQFHGDADAQKIRQRAKERLAADKFMGLSIGFVPEEWHYEGDDDSEVRVLDRIKLYEVSLVTVPAEANSQVFAIKGHGIPFEEHTSQVRVALDEWLSRCKAGSAERAKSGRALSAERHALMEDFSGSLKEFAQVVDALLSEPDEQEVIEAAAENDPPATEDPLLKQLTERHLKLMAAYGGT